jgi:Carbohydrate family 9 binding domain-like
MSRRRKDQNLKQIVLMLALLLALLQLAPAADNSSFDSTQVPEDVALTTDPMNAFWKDAGVVFAEEGKNSESVGSYRTEIRSRWTDKNLYFLFICPYETLYLKPEPRTSTETYELWDWDVAEVFLGTDFKNIRKYKEFEISPQGEWIDLDIDLTKPHHEDGWRWNSGFVVSARVDREARIWYGAMRIPFSALGISKPRDGETFRINLFRSQGPPSHRVQIAWRRTMRETFHVPERFGILRLTATPMK